MLTMPLPFETLSHIFSFLPKSSLKTLRLASREFYDVATPLLFDSIFVSARHVDREVADSVAARFPDSIQRLTFATEFYHIPHWSEFESKLESRPTKCENPTLHVKKTKQFWALYCKIESEGKTLYDSGAVHAQLCHLLNTLPNLRQIVITDKRRRQDLSWLQEALVGVTVRHVPRPEARIPLASDVRGSLADLRKLRKETTSLESYKDMWVCIRSSLKGLDVQAQAQLQTTPSVGCNCFDVIDKEPPFIYHGRYSSLAEAATPWAPQNPWTVIMTALHKSPNASIHMISIQPKNAKNPLNIKALNDSNLDTLHARNNVLARLTKLELRLAHTSLMGLETGKTPIKMLSGACKLRSLTIDIMNDEDATSSLLVHWHKVPKTTITTFESLLAGCKLPHLSILHLHRVTFLENDFSTFLQRSPELRELSLQGFYMVDGWHRWRPPYPDPRAWERILQTVKETLRHLENFDLSARQLCDGEQKYEDSLVLRSMVSTGERMRGFDTLVQRFLFDEGTNPFAEIVV